MELSIIVPMYNEEANVVPTVAAIAEQFQASGLEHEILLVNDGSTDQTAVQIKAVQETYPQVKGLHHRTNLGRGAGLRTGFAHATGDFVVTAEADLAYSPDHVKRIYETLKQDETIDVVLGSAYMPGGTVEGVSLFRRLLSRYGNRFLSLAFHGKYQTVTCTLRGYRKEVLQSFDLESDGKEMHLEILAKAEDLRLNIVEIPAHLRSRKLGRTKFKFLITSATHMLFSISERPSLLFGYGGLLMFVTGIGIGTYIIFLWQMARLNPTRPLVTLMGLFIITGVIFFLFGFLSRELRYLRKEIHSIRFKLNEVRKKLDN